MRRNSSALPLKTKQLLGLRSQRKEQRKQPCLNVCVFARVCFQGEAFMKTNGNQRQLTDKAGTSDNPPLVPPSVMAAVVKST